jgi:hypothetical protein
VRTTQGKIKWGAPKFLPCACLMLYYTVCTRQERRKDRYGKGKKPRCGSQWREGAGCE